MTAPDARGRRPSPWRLAGIGLLPIGVAIALYVAGRLVQPDYAFSLFGADPIPAKSLLASIVLALAGVQVLLALWIYRKLPLAPCPARPVPVVHRVTGFVLFAVTVPVAVHCLIAYGVQLTSTRVAIHSVAGCFFYGAFAAKVLLIHSRRAAAGPGSAGGRRDARGRHRRCVVHLGVVVLQRLPAPRLLAPTLAAAIALILLGAYLITQQLLR